MTYSEGEINNFNEIITEIANTNYEVMLGRMATYTAKISEVFDDWNRAVMGGRNVSVVTSALYGPYSDVVMSDMRTVKADDLGGSCHQFEGVLGIDSLSVAHVDPSNRQNSLFISGENTIVDETYCGQIILAHFMTKNKLGLLVPISVLSKNLQEAGEPKQLVSKFTLVSSK